MSWGKGLLKRHLEIFVSRIPPIPDPRPELEQYASPPHLVSRILWVAEGVFGDVSGRVIADLGAGTGRLGLAAAYMGAEYVVMLELDFRLSKLAKETALELGMGGVVDCVCGDTQLAPLRKGFDTVIQNPPFGVQRKGADLAFLRTAMGLAKVVYSVHKAETAEFIVRKISEWGGRARVLFREKILLPPVMSFHFKRKHKVDVVVIRAEVSEGH